MPLMLKQVENYGCLTLLKKTARTEVSAAASRKNLAKHASWLNMAEIEINIMDKECLGRNIGNRKELEKELETWCDQNNKEKRKIYWSFTRKKADTKLSKYYVS